MGGQYRSIVVAAEADGGCFGENAGVFRDLGSCHKAFAFAGDWDDVVKLCSLSGGRSATAAVPWLGFASSGGKLLQNSNEVTTGRNSGWFMVRSSLTERLCEHSLPSAGTYRGGCLIGQALMEGNRSNVTRTPLGWMVCLTCLIQTVGSV